MAFMALQFATNYNGSASLLKRRGNVKCVGKCEPPIQFLDFIGGKLEKEKRCQFLFASFNRVEARRFLTVL